MRMLGSIALASSVQRLTLRRLLYTHNMGVRPLAPLYVSTLTFVKVVCAYMRHIPKCHQIFNLCGLSNTINFGEMVNGKQSKP